MRDATVPSAEATVLRDETRRSLLADRGRA